MEPMKKNEYPMREKKQTKEERDFKNGAHKQREINLKKKKNTLNRKLKKPRSQGEIFFIKDVSETYEKKK